MIVVGIKKVVRHATLEVDGEVADERAVAVIDDNVEEDLKTMT